MKTFTRLMLLAVIAMSGFTPVQGDNVEFVCIKTHKASNTCYFNFKVDGAKYRYTDIGCKNTKKKNEIIQQAKEGTLALAKDWKIECPEVKESAGQ